MAIKAQLKTAPAALQRVVDAFSAGDTQIQAARGALDAAKTNKLESMRAALTGVSAVSLAVYEKDWKDGIRAALAKTYAEKSVPVTENKVRAVILAVTNGLNIEAADFEGFVKEARAALVNAGITEAASQGRKPGARHSAKGVTGASKPAADEPITLEEACAFICDGDRESTLMLQQVCTSQEGLEALLDACKGIIVSMDDKARGKPERKSRFQK